MAIAFETDLTEILSPDGKGPVGGASRVKASGKPKPVEPTTLLGLDNVDTDSVANEGTLKSIWNPRVASALKAAKARRTNAENPALTYTNYFT